MASKRHERRRAREGALALLYSGDITERDVVDIVEQGAYPDEGIKVSDYAERLVQGVVEHQDEIDKRLSSTSENWALDRMPLVDRAILRVAVFEMLFVDEVPVSVAINEAVELAKLYGGEDESSRFVNGVLGRIARALESEKASEDQQAETSDQTDVQPAEAAHLQDDTSACTSEASDGEVPHESEGDTPVAQIRDEA